MIKNASLIALSALFVTACATSTLTPMPGALPPSDIAGIVMAANEGEVQQGQAASQRATNPQVRSFAEMMVADHTTAMNNARDVFGREGITAGENDTTRTLRANSQRTITNLNTYSGAAFDREYMETQVALHQWTLNTLDTVLIPSAASMQVRTLLEAHRATVAAHLDQARQILGTL